MDNGRMTAWHNGDELFNWPKELVYFVSGAKQKRKQKKNIWQDIEKKFYYICSLSIQTNTHTHKHFISPRHTYLHNIIYKITTFYTNNKYSDVDIEMSFIFMQGHLEKKY